MLRARSAAAGHMGRLGHIETTARFQMSRAHMIPAAKLLHGDVEAIGHRHQRVAMCDLVKREPGFAGRRRGHRNDQRIGGGEIVAGSNWLTKTISDAADMVVASHRFERLSGHHFVKPPLIPLVRGNFGDALLKQIFAARGKMQLKGSVGGSAHPQQAGIEVCDLLNRRFRPGRRPGAGPHCSWW